MKLKELIELLKQFDPETECQQSGSWCGEYDGTEELTPPYVDPQTNKLHFGG